MAELRVFFDADALLAGSASTTGASHLLLHLSDLGLIRGLTSEQAHEEARRNLARKVPEALPEFDALIRQALEIIPNPSLEELRPFGNRAHPKDLPILAAAVLAGARWLVTFNTKDYYEAPPGTRVLEPGQAIQAIRAALIQAADSQ